MTTQKRANMEDGKQLHERAVAMWKLLNELAAVQRGLDQMQLVLSSGVGLAERGLFHDIRPPLRRW